MYRSTTDTKLLTGIPVPVPDLGTQLYIIDPQAVDRATSPDDVPASRGRVGQETIGDQVTGERLPCGRERGVTGPFGKILKLNLNFEPVVALAGQRFRQRSNVPDMEGLSASVVLIAILLCLLLVVVFDVFCLLRLGTADTDHLVPRFAWAVLIVGASPIGGVVYLLAQRLRRRSPEPVAMRPSPSPGSSRWHGPALAEYNRAPASPLGHGVAVMAIAGAAYLAQAGQILAAVAVTVILVIIAFLRGTPPG